MEDLWMRTVTTDVNITNTIQEIEERISGAEEKHSRNLRHYKKAKPKSNRNRRKRRFSFTKSPKIFSTKS